MGSKNLLVALAGQPNCGKSTVFNMLTGARQHVANYPGVTVEKKTGHFKLGDTRVELVDLPGTYSLTSYSLEERVARDFILHDKPAVIIDVVDASNLKRNLYLTLQLLEMEVPTIIDLNMMDVAERRDIKVDYVGLAKYFGVPVVPTTGKKGVGGNDVINAVAQAAQLSEYRAFAIDYGTLEPFIEKVESRVAEDHRMVAAYPARWLAVKLLENDTESRELLKKYHPESGNVLEEVDKLRADYHQSTNTPAERHIAFSRHRVCAQIAKQFVKAPTEKRKTMSDMADKYVCNRFWGPVILVSILLLLYQISIVWGGELAVYIWPVWGGIESFTAEVLPRADFLGEPLLRSLGIWVVKSATAILNYLPIFFLLFSLIAILEDSGYMPRMAFILDRLFRRFGLHGQSTLPLILGGVYVGGCAIPGVMSTKAIPDERARLATILIVPMMNCLAKVPLYLILIGAYFADHAGLAMFFIATVTLFMALPIAKALSLTVLSKRESAPFIMEMPPYHLPTFNGVLRRAFERIWLFVKKIVTVVVAVAVVIFVLINFPGLSKERMAFYEAKRDAAIGKFMKAVDETSYKDVITAADVTALILFEEDLKNAKRGVTDQAESEEINKRFEQGNPSFYAVVKRQGAEGKRLNKALKKVVQVRKKLRREMRAERFESSFLGVMGHALEPVTQWAGFNWRINIALLSAFAAKENSAATLGSIYGIDGTEQSVQESMKLGETGFTALHALALMLFMALYPPCVPTSIMVRMQSNSTKWMLFSIFYQTLLGLGIATLIFTGGTLLGLTGFQAMWAFYGLCVAATVIMAMVPHRQPKDSINCSSDRKNCFEGGTK